MRGYCCEETKRTLNDRMKQVLEASTVESECDSKIWFVLIAVDGQDETVGVCSHVIYPVESAAL
jgi:hypothetical protein